MKTYPALKNEQTSKRVAAIAGRLLKETKKAPGTWMAVKVAEVKAMAGSLVTQAPNKK